MILSLVSLKIDPCTPEGVYGKINPLHEDNIEIKKNCTIP